MLRDKSLVVGDMMSELHNQHDEMRTEMIGEKLVQGRLCGNREGLKCLAV